MKFCIIGCGLIGQKRARAISKKYLISWVVDKNLTSAENLSEQYKGCNYTDSWKEAIESSMTDAVIIALPHDLLEKVALFSIKKNKPTFIEKPGAISAKSMKKILLVAKSANVTVKIGYNHRFHPTILKAKEIINAETIGDLMYVRGRYGHGGRKGYDQEWRSKKSISGGGELLDQGSHLIDLSQMFLGDLDKVSGKIYNYFWNMEVEDNAFIALENEKGQSAWLHASWTEWKNLFSFEIFGKKGKLQIDGLGGSYGVEKLTLFKMLPELGPPETTCWEYPFEDKSWNIEIDNFVESISNCNNSDGSLENALYVLKVINKIYQQNINK